MAPWRTEDLSPYVPTADEELVTQFGMDKLVHAEVDPRTGVFLCTITLPAVIGNHLAGPTFQPRLRFHPSAVDSGFGNGWSLNLTCFNTTTGKLTLPSGRSYLLDPGLSEHDLVTEEGQVRVTKDGDRYVVAHRDGVREVLVAADDHSGRALPVEIWDHGRCVRLEYTSLPSSAMAALSSVTEESGYRLMEFDHSSKDEVHVTVAPGDYALEARWTLNLRDGRLSALQLPTEDKASFAFDYDSRPGWLVISGLTTPLRTRHSVLYGGAGHAFPSSSVPNLPRVTSHEISGTEQPRTTLYTYPDGPNYLGHGLKVQWNGQDDPLQGHEALPPETYYNGPTETETVEGAEGRTVTRTYNAFHLLTKEETVRGDKTETREVVYYALPGVPTKSQPPQYRSPRTITRSWSSKGDPAKNRQEREEFDVDSYGNTISVTHPDGRRETREFYPAKGDTGCPADPLGLTRFLKATTTFPASEQSGAVPVTSTRHTYTSVPTPATATGEQAAVSVVAADDVTVELVGGQEEKELSRVRRDYLTGGPFAGQLSRETVTESGRATSTTYVYKQEENKLLATSTTTSYEGNIRTTAITRLLFNGLLHARIQGDEEVRWEYDALGRVIRETTAPYTPQEYARLWHYILPSAAGEVGQVRETK